MTLKMRGYDSSSLLGRGTYSTVYRAGEDEVIKYIPSVNATHIPSSCIWDICIPTTLHHRNIVRISKVEFDDMGVHITMPLYTPIDRIDMTVMHGLIHALQYMHENNVIHRDLKKANIMMDGDQPIIIDFSISRVGLLPVMSPNVYSGYHRLHKVLSGKYGFEADTYSLGVTFFQIMTGYSSTNISSMNIGGMMSVCDGYGEEGRIVGRLLQCESLTDILRDTVFSSMTEPLHSLPRYRDRRELSQSELNRISRAYSLYRDLPPVTLKLAESILSQMNESAMERIDSVIAIAVSLASDDFVFDVRMKVLDMVVRNMKVDL